MRPERRTPLRLPPASTVFGEVFPGAALSRGSFTERDGEGALLGRRWRCFRGDRHRDGAGGAVRALRTEPPPASPGSITGMTGAPGDRIVVRPRTSGAGWSRASPPSRRYSPARAVPAARSVSSGHIGQDGDNSRLGTSPETGRERRESSVSRLGMQQDRGVAAGGDLLRPWQGCAPAKRVSRSGKAAAPIPLLDRACGKGENLVSGVAM